MERRKLGETGLEVPAVGLGTYRVFHVSGDAEEARCEAVVDTALDAGANFFDSSPMYGRAEEVLARMLEDRRDDAIVATKVWARTRAIGEGQIETALDWFGTVDVYQIHNLLAAGDHLPFLQKLKEEGRIRTIGASHYLPSAYADLMEMMRHREIDVIQIPYHPLERSAARELLDEAERLGVGVIAMTPFASGNLLRATPTPEELAPLADFGVFTWPQALLKWALSDRRVHVAIPATSSPDHMRDNVVAGLPPWLGGDERLYVRRLAEKLGG